VRFEPAFSRAIDLAVGEELVTWVGGDRLQISAKGKRWVKDILKDESLMREEREFLKKIGKTVTEKAAEQILGSKGVR
jgi:tRNA(Ile)-lysidine synthetase-like protein